MTDVWAMSPDELREEARRRWPRPPSPAEVQARLEEKDNRLERDIQADVRKLFIAFGCRVYNLSQARASKQSAGLSDLYVIHERMRAAWWFETKTPTGKPTTEQIEFMALNAVAGVPVVIGGIRAGEEHLIRIGVAERDPSGSLELRR